MSRPSIDEYLMKMARSAAARATCPDMACGCVIATADGHVLSVGYNGVPRGEAHCRVGNGGRCLENGPDHRVVHAEQNAVAFAARHGIRLEGGTAYVTAKPCAKCAALLKQAGIKRTVTP